MLSKLTPEQKYYLIGFLQGDGCHSKSTRNRGKVVIEISKRDEDILNKIESFLSPIWNCGFGSRARDIQINGYNYTNKDFVSLCVCDVSFRSEIQAYVPIGKKSNILIPPCDNSQLDQVKHYLRGYMDADGSIGLTNRSPQIPFVSFTVSSEQIKSFIVENIFLVLGIEKRLNRNQRDNLYNIVLYREDAVEYAKYLYSNSELHLNRKYEKFGEVQRWQRTIPRRKGRKKSWLPYEDFVILSDNYSVAEKCVLLKRTKQSINTRIWRLTSSNK